jgi:hypothetical protein
MPHHLLQECLPSWVVRLLNCVPEVVARADRKMLSSVVK